MKTYLTNARVVLEDDIFNDVALVFEEGVITEICTLQ
jgi:N-acetylglucosamine-6-phosphate deacetylase